ncbi:hypothetical protein Q5762_22135 [Streptomyces sp. P9(2023)]|uniref:hypothetical protein n=1 Tax=Streptomyces sp. P9(2023) TaxID=3064394 RepID=UPI0028F40C6B|nr:hypothetical protein [Streptomyces sp. P9(2023)]MDT9691000.1 hypothetical protein [Streptomyces sp. P9(2023)]
MGETHGCGEGQVRFPGASLENLEKHLLIPEARSCSPECWEQVRDIAVGGMQRHDLADEARLQWGRLALSAISKKYREDLPQRAMAESASVRAYMIKEFGLSNADPARNLSALCSDVLRDLGGSLEVAARLAGEWRTAPPEQMLQLRRIKNMLTPLLPIRALLEGDDPAMQDIRFWLELVPMLP